VGELIISSSSNYNGKLYGEEMTEIQRELLDVVTQVRTHLEYQKALGVRQIEAVSPPNSDIASPVPLTRVEKPIMPAVSKPSRESAGLSAICEELGDCTRCKLHKGRTNIVFGEGNPKAVLVFVGEGPGQEEDHQGRPFVGAAGQLLTDIIVKGMKIKRDEVFICNIVKCRPPGNRNPEPDEIEACEPFLKKQLAAIHPAVIVALGNTAVKTLLKTAEGITTLRGKWQTYQGIPLMPTFHPAYLLRNPSGKKLVWEDIQRVMKKLEMQAKG
jgi:uracil-DNA glycosylase family 4